MLRLARPAVLTLALATLAACAHDSPSMRGLPLPRDWQAPPAPATQDGFGWGVPPFAPPSASDCRRSPVQREVPGARADGQLLGALRSSSRLADAAREAAGSSTDAPAAAATAKSRAEERDGGSQAPRPSAQVSAGMVDDNADWSEYLAFRNRGAHLSLRRRDVVERYRVEVRDALDRPVPDAELALAWAGAGARSASSTVWARSDAGGTAWLHPRAVLPPEADGQPLEVQVRTPQSRAGAQQVARASLQRGQKHNLVLRLPAAVEVARPQLDLVFLVDATGSMGDEIAKLKASMASIAEQIAALPGRPELCFGLVGYRDRGDQFLTRTHDFTDRLPEFQSALARLHAAAGGDYPEALNEALHEAVHGLSWRGGSATRLVVLVADAPPHLDYGGPQYDETAAAALAKGIKLHAVGASGLDAQGEAVFRQIAQYTGGRFVFLTYRDAHDPRSGPGSETVHDVRGYSVDSLDRLVVRLVREELARRPS